LIGSYENLKAGFLRSLEKLAIADALPTALVHCLDLVLIQELAPRGTFLSNRTRKGVLPFRVTQQATDVVDFEPELLGDLTD
jgi:hypothetical protein